jgi:hypothetical protein
MGNLATRAEGRRPKAAREGKRGKWGTLFSGHYGDLGSSCGAAHAGRWSRRGGGQGAIESSGLDGRRNGDGCGALEGGGALLMDAAAMRHPGRP